MQAKSESGRTGESPAHGTPVRLRWTPRLPFSAIRRILGKTDDPFTEMDTKAELLDELDNTNRRTLELFDSLDEKQLEVPYEPGVNPPVWELGHAAFFYEYFVLRALDDTRPRMPGYDEIWDSFEIRHRDRWEKGVVPDKQTTLDYYHGIIDSVRNRIADKPLEPDEHYLYKYAVFHQNMHLESLIWCRQTLGYPAPPSAESFTSDTDDSQATSEKAGDARVAEGIHRIGIPADSENFATSHFAFDNEKPGCEARLEAFSISKTLVSNREFLEFVEGGGYEKPGAWSFGGRRWLETNERLHPCYWRKTADGSWQERFFDDWRDLNLAAPVMHVSFWEAEAFCRWAGRRLPTEFEWEAAARSEEGHLYPWGDSLDPSRTDMDGVALGRRSVHALPRGAARNGCLQMLGTAWEWTSSQFLPFDGFKVDMYPYMSTLQFGDHKTTRGGSCATSSCLIRNTYRQAYFPDRQDVFTGFRTCAL